MNFDEILLEQAQKELLIALVEASRKQPRDRREKFYAIQASGGTVITGVDYPDLFMGDLETLAHLGLLFQSYGSHGAKGFDITPLGYQYYEYLMKSKSSSAIRIEERIFHYLNSASFAKRRPQAFAKWQQAEELLWGSDSQIQHTAIGHHCREAMRFFATSLVEKFQAPDVDQDITKTIKRVEAVLKQTAEQMSDGVAAIIEAMFQYWRTLNDLTQRQEHGAQKEGEALTWEDSRRLVFQTAIVMFEIDSTLKDIE